jgi:hypothetical protein
MPGKSPPEALARLQAGFAAHIRDPHGAPAPKGIEDRRMAIYRDLFFNNIRNFLSSNFPVLKTLFNEADWTELCRDFFKTHRCHTPIFAEIPREFLKYLQDVRQARDSDPAFLLELAHYEWVELALSLDESEPGELELNPDGDLMAGVPVLSPLAWPLSYRFPVHRISRDYQPRTPPEKATHLLVWRRHDFDIKFMLLNEFSLLLIQKLKEDAGLTGLQLLTEIADVTNHPNADTVIEGGRALLGELRDKQIILGAKP